MEDGALMVKSMLDLRLLDSYCPDRPEEQQVEQEEVRFFPYFKVFLLNAQLT